MWQILYLRTICDQRELHILKRHGRRKLGYYKLRTLINTKKNQSKKEGALRVEEEEKAGGRRTGWVHKSF